MDEEAGRLLDEQAGDRSCRDGTANNRYGANLGYGRGGNGTQIAHAVYGDTGGPSRFFFCGKARKAERGEGNTHSTVKPLSLMEWLCRLVTPPGGLVLDPFAGSGTTGVAALKTGRRFVLIEKEPEYVAIAQKRLAEAAGPLFATVGGGP